VDTIEEDKEEAKINSDGAQSAGGDEVSIVGDERKRD
jgi:hypothetical protein